jgi:hypothetical protein
MRPPGTGGACASILQTGWPFCRVAGYVRGGGGRDRVPRTGRGLPLLGVRHPHPALRRRRARASGGTSTGGRREEVRLELVRDAVSRRRPAAVRGRRGFAPGRARPAVRTADGVPVYCGPPCQQKAYRRRAAARRAVYVPDPVAQLTQAAAPFAAGSAGGISQSLYRALYRLQTAYRDGPQGQETALARLALMGPGRLRIPDTADGHRLRAALLSVRDRHAQP